VRKMFVLVVALVFSGVALAATTAYFVSASTGINSNGFLVVTFKEAGLPRGSSVMYNLSAYATATYVCVSQGHGKKLSTPGTSVSQNVSSTATMDAGKNGRIVGGLAAAPPEATGFSCRNGTSLQLANVTYTNVEMVDATTPLDAPLTGTCAGSSGCTDVLIRQ
jgi:hypothetical protein